jgi:hypothetical protein
MTLQLNGNTPKIFLCALQARKSKLERLHFFEFPVMMDDEENHLHHKSPENLNGKIRSIQKISAYLHS